MIHINKSHSLSVAVTLLIIFTLLYYRYPPIENTGHSVSKPPLSTVEYVNAVVSASYHDTLIVDFLLPEDFKMGTGQVSEAKGKLIRAELAWQAEYLALQKRVTGRKKKNIWELYPATFTCPWSVAQVGWSGKWICGFELFKIPPRPDECVVYTFGNENRSSSAFAKDWVSNTECMAFMFQFNDKEEPPFINSSVEVYPEQHLSSARTLKQVLKDNDHGWIDVLLLDINGDEYEVLEQVMDDYDEVLPFAQLIVDFHLDNKRMFIFEKVFAKLVVRGFRPYYMRVLEGNQNVGYSTVLEYSFLNLRGKHLLLVGKSGIVM
ncbi:unnamed protein product [Orchesella dallaii]|uniref:Methyltransferase FkbM domain-containing protein n=1 Tax=Orchesella dallaii TaxID=48710 RepID=A0ABP1S6I0_9HEXA